LENFGDVKPIGTRNPNSNNWSVIVIKCEKIDGGSTSIGIGIERM